jgi:cell division protein FtsB
MIGSDTPAITAAALRSLAAERDALQAENEKLRAENAKLAASNHAYLSDYQEARGEIEKLRAALGEKE